MGMTKEEESGPWIPRQEVKRKGVKVNHAVMQELLRPHIDSYDYFVQRGLSAAILAIQPIEVEDPVSGNKLRIFLENPSIGSPLKDTKDKVDHRLFPDQCRQAGLSYKGHFSIDVCMQYNDSAVCSRENTSFGKFPIMVKSSICNLRGLNPQQLIQHNEEPREMGGYFICNGIERIIRMLILPKRNHPIALKRPSFQNRGAGFTDKAIVMRCVRQDQTASTIRLYYLQNGNAVLGFTFRRQEFILPVGLILKALIDTSDREIYDQLRVICKEGHEHTKGAVGSKGVDTKGVVGSQVVDQRARIILEDVHRFNLYTRLECLQFIGETFRTHLGVSKNLASITIGEMVLSSNILVHLQNPRDKFNLLIHMLHKLFALVDGTAAVDNSDTLQYQEALLPGHLLNIYVKDRLEDWLQRLKSQLSKDISSKTGKFDLQNANSVKETLKKVNAAEISRRVEYLLSTGNLQSNSFLDLQQNTGFTVVAEKLNFLRYFSHFRSIHRGLYFARQRTTTVRKLLPESWGFLCPVHTPDGEPCGLLCHLSSQCSISTDLDHRGKVKDFLLIRKKITALLMERGMITAVSSLASVAPPDYLCVLLDGCIIGHIPTCLIPRIISFLRREKVEPTSEVPADLEVAYIPCTYAGAYPGLFLFTTPARLLRPVKQLQSSDGVDWSHREDFPLELISPFEQAYMEIVCPDGKDGGRAGASASAPATHSEIHPTAMLSVVASLTPWSDHNQSPRNMYQCQMGKQTMGIPGQALQFRYDHKLYRLQTPQSPLAQTTGYRKFHMDDYPMGTNAVVAVLAYTGYDMEDAMIINKSSMERGLCHGQIIKTETIDLEKLRKKGDSIVNVFGREAKGSKSLDIDGMPYIGQPLQDGDVFCTSLNTMNQKAKHHKLKAAEPVVVDTVAAIGTGGILQKVNIRMRHGRNPVIGDKFSSRHGQKGVLSQLWPDINMPFSAVTGMRPDIIINPHAFPSRMTIGMLLESMAAKAGTLEGRFVDSTPFQRSGSNMGKNSNKPPNDSYRSRFGESLVAHGFNYHGTEVMYSGILGTEMACEIYFGVVYYQRLRHMVSDKFQMRSTGTVNPVTKQPVGGRKAGGGIRFGEMERDSLLAHGAAYLLHDRLHACSDYHIADVCSLCGSLLAPLRSNEYEIGSNTHLTTPGLVTKATCRWCETGKGIVRVAMPFVFRYLAAELTAMNVKLTLTVLPSH